MEKVITIKIEKKERQWDLFVEINRFEVGIDELVVDFGPCWFVGPFHAVLLACLIEEYHQHNVKVSFQQSEIPKLKDYLSQIEFFEFWEEGRDRGSFRQTAKITNLCLWQLNPARLSPYVVHAQQYFENNFLKEKDFEPLNICLAELFNNIVDHADSHVSGFTTSQYYPKSNELKIAVCDFGIGIPNKVNNHLRSEGKPTVSPAEALKLAFQNKFSTRSTPQNRGFGLDTLLHIVASCKGSLRVVSNEAMMEFSNDNMTVSQINHNFRGTHFEVILNTGTFETKVQETFEDDFSF